MARLNQKPKPIHTHEGARAKHILPEMQLRRSVMACMLFEDEFYESGQTISERIRDLVPQVHPRVASNVAIEARENQKLRHVPLLIVREMARHETFRPYVREALARVIQRPDEICEFLAHYWADGKCPLANQVKLGLADAFGKFDEYQLQKWDKPNEIKLRDAMFLCHPRPVNPEQEALWKRLIDGTMVVADTWETKLSSTTDTRSKKEKWTEMLEKTVAREKGSLGIMALLRNLRNFNDAGVDRGLVKKALAAANPAKALPFRFIAAAKHAPNFEPEIEAAMFKCLAANQKMPGHTVVLVDVSYSMNAQLSGKSETRRIDAAFGVAMLLREICEDVDILSFAGNLAQVPARRGFALADALWNSQGHNATYLGGAVRHVTLPRARGGAGLKPDRLIVITDEQSMDPVGPPNVPRGYMINVASAKNGVGYGDWLHIDGWSESVVHFIQEMEAAEFL